MVIKCGECYGRWLQHDVRASKTGSKMVGQRKLSGGGDVLTECRKTYRS